MKRSAQFLLFILVFALGGMLFANTPPTVTNVSASQRTDGSRIVDIWYSVNDADNDTLTVSIAVSNDNGATFVITPSPANLSGAVGENILSGNNKHIVWNAGAEGVSFDGSQFKVKVTATEKINLSYGLVAYYPFNGNANDESGNGFSGTMDNTINTMDRFGTANRALYFNGYNSEINVYNVPLSLHGNTEFSVSMWIKPEFFNYGWFIAWGFPDTNKGYHIGARWGSVNYDFGYWNYGIHSPISVTWNVWQHICVIRQANMQKLYIDSSLAYQGSLNGATPNISNGIIRIGRQIGDFQEYSKGTIDDIRIYNRALVQSDIDVLYHEGGWNGN